MPHTLPGTTIPVDPGQPDAAETVLKPLFLAGGLMLSQVAQLTGLEPYTVQNWVRRGFVSPPVRKRYSRRQFCRIATINLLKDCLQLDKICCLLSYVNGDLDDESDDLIDDAQLYGYVSALTLRMEQGVLPTQSELDAWCAQALEPYKEVIPGAKARVEQVLRIIMTAWFSCVLKRRAETLITQLDTNEGKEV